MNEFKGTPGPWAVENDIHGKLHVTGGGFDLAEVGVSPGSDIRADARLMAAAPDLLNACQQALEELKKYVLTPHPEGSDGARGFCVKVMHIEAAITKALGEKP